MAGPNHHPSSIACEPSSSCCGCAPTPNLATRPAPFDRCNTCDQRAPSLPPEPANPNSDNHQPQDPEHVFRGFHLAPDRVPSSAPATPDTAARAASAAVDDEPGHPAGPDPTVQHPPADDDPVERELNHLFQEGCERKKKRQSLKRCNGTKPKRVQPEPQGQDNQQRDR